MQLCSVEVPAQLNLSPFASSLQHDFPTASSLSCPRSASHFSQPLSRFAANPLTTPLLACSLQYRRGAGQPGLHKTAQPERTNSRFSFQLQPAVTSFSLMKHCRGVVPILCVAAACLVALSYANRGTCVPDSRYKPVAEQTGSCHVPVEAVPSVERCDDDLLESYTYVSPSGLLLILTVLFKPVKGTSLLVKMLVPKMSQTRPICGLLEGIEKAVHLGLLGLHW